MHSHAEEEAVHCEDEFFEVVFLAFQVFRSAVQILYLVSVNMNSKDNLPFS